MPFGKLLVRSASEYRAVHFHLRSLFFGTCFLSSGTALPYHASLSPCAAKLHGASQCRKCTATFCNWQWQKIPALELMSEHYSKDLKSLEVQERLTIFRSQSLITPILFPRFQQVTGANPLQAVPALWNMPRIPSLWSQGSPGPVLVQWCKSETRMSQDSEGGFHDGHWSILGTGPYNDRVHFWCRFRKLGTQP